MVSRRGMSRRLRALVNDGGIHVLPGVFNAITASERALGEMTVYISGQIHLKNQEPVNIGNVFSSDMNGPGPQR